MEKILTREQLNTLDKSILIDMYLGMAAEMKALSSKMDILLEQLALANTRAFAAKTEKNLLHVDERQLNFFNED